MATHSSILAWRIPWTEEPGGLQSTGSQRVVHNWAISLSKWAEYHNLHRDKWGIQRPIASSENDSPNESTIALVRSLTLISESSFFFFLNIYLFILAVLVLVPARGIFIATWGLLSCWACKLLCCGMHVVSSSLTRNWTWAPCNEWPASYPLDHQWSPSECFLDDLFYQVKQQKFGRKQFTCPELLTFPGLVFGFFLI